MIKEFNNFMKYFGLPVALICYLVFHVVVSVLSILFNAWCFALFVLWATFFTDDFLDDDNIFDYLTDNPSLHLKVFANKGFFLDFCGICGYISLIITLWQILCYFIGL